jgi:hypothetical protein
VELNLLHETSAAKGRREFRSVRLGVPCDVVVYVPYPSVECAPCCTIHDESSKFQAQQQQSWALWHLLLQVNRKMWTVPDSGRAVGRWEVGVGDMIRSGHAPFLDSFLYNAARNVMRLHSNMSLLARGLLMQSSKVHVVFKN